MTTKTYDFRDDLALDSLQLQLRNKEGLGRELKKLEALETDEKRFTLATLDSSATDKTGLRLVLDPNGNLQAGAGEQLVCRGEAWVQTSKEKVAAFRPAG